MLFYKGKESLMVVKIIENKGTDTHCIDKISVLNLVVGKLAY